MDILCRVSIKADMKGEIFFTEKQRFTQIWIWVILIGINALFIFGIVQQLLLETPFGDKPIPLAGLIAAAVLSLVFAFGFLSMKLETEIKTEGVYVRFSPFQRTYQFCSWDSIDKIFIRKYSPVSEYGGWGLRGVSSRDRALNVSGNTGIQIITKDGLRLLIGTKKGDEVMEVLKQIGHLTT
jgi:hypothetical protein